MVTIDNRPRMIPRACLPVLCAVVALALLGGCSGTKTRVDELPELNRVDSDLRLRGSWYRQPQMRRQPHEARLTPFVAGERLFYSDRPDRVVALHARTGKLQWKTSLPPPPDMVEKPVRLSGGVGAGEGYLFVGTDEGEMIALNPDDGSIHWRAQLSGEVLATPVASAGVLVVRTNDGRITALDIANGSPRWTYASSVPVLTLRGASRPVIDQGRVFVGFATGRLAALALDSGDVLWEATVGMPKGRSELERMVDIDADPILADGVIYAAAYQARLVALTSVAGSVLWSRDLSIYQGMVSDADTLYLTRDDGQVVAVNRRTGAVMWQQDGLAGRMTTAPVMYRGQLFVADRAGYLHALAPDDGRFVARFRIAADAIPHAPVAYDDALYILTADGALHAMRIDPGGEAGVR